MGTRAARVALAGYLLVAALGTLVPTLGPAVVFSAVRDFQAASGASWGTSGRLVEPGLNVLLFVPLGALLCGSLPRLRGRWVWALCTLTSVGVEMVQAALVQSRIASPWDVVANSAGAALGVLVHHALRRRRRAGAAAHPRS
ncbi:VanZ family protein [Goekera deserti]|uniref:VanZ family protein n=1 Tax=Goekera deserti TaxID=2497753 RepID=A0A7K3WF93_9ACTN|nr:VanZ family protein [Goekera deserti]NDI48549.1 hypothetical protein [Goekera deserti]NEL55072.1 VanZ family protein [Goekera deserti]